MLTKLVQIVLFGVLMKVSGFKTDCGYNRRLAHIYVPIQKTLDYYKLDVIQPVECVGARAVR